MLGSLFLDLATDQGARSPHDWRIAAVDQNTPKTLESDLKPQPSTRNAEHSDLSVLLWTTAVLCFCLERWLSSFPVIRPASTTSGRVGVVEATRS